MAADADPSAGFEVRRIGRHEYLYREAGGELIIPGEAIVTGLGRARFGFAFWLDQGKAWSGNPHRPVTAEDRDRMKRNITVALAAEGGMAVFE
jgi:hypothetical protein